MVLDLDRDGRRLQTWQRNHRANQLWCYDSATLAVVNVHTGQVLDIDRDGSSLLVWEARGSPNQQWVFDHRIQAIVNPSTGKVLDVDGDPCARGMGCVVRRSREGAAPMPSRGRAPSARAPCAVVCSSS